MMIDNHSCATVETARDIVEIGAANDAVEAHAAADMLNSAGIDVQIVGESLSAARGGIPFGESTAPRLWVTRGDAPRAAELLSQWRSQVAQKSTTSTIGPYPPGTRVIFTGLIALLLLFYGTYAVTDSEVAGFCTTFTWWLFAGYAMFVVYYHKQRRTMRNDDADE